MRFEPAPFAVGGIHEAQWDWQSLGQGSDSIVLTQ